MCIRDRYQRRVRGSISTPNIITNTVQMKQTILLILCVLAYTFARECPNVPTAKEIPSRYAGVWYEIATVPLAKETFERNCFCTFANYTIAGPQQVTVINTCNVDSVNGRVDVTKGNAIIPDLAQPGKLEVSFGGPYAPYWIINLDTNYQWAVIWSCTDILGFDIEFLWVLSRTPTLDETLYQQLIQKAASETGYDISRLLKTTQQGCTYSL
eukprot:TRINITY_DN357_c0_g1_i2.p1 TRINITY_DN357_c0_g1~~TRINITY_DN357_c0_g1_i2.p1  ORF type:complete len:212 (-),score=41.96 TRINITY_DN357_c0_g1_i2:60-695(-)